MITIFHNSHWVFLALFLSPFFALGQNGADGSFAYGTWLSENGNEKIAIYERNGMLFGTIVWMKDIYDNEGKLRIDEHNPDSDLRSRPLVGIEILHDFKFVGDGWFTGGKIYDPSSGNTYHARIKLVNEKTAKIRGFIGIPIFGRTEICTKLAE